MRLTLDMHDYDYQTSGQIYRDDRGFILDCGEGEFKAIQTIFSRKGSIRSNHYHLKGGHLLHVISGKMRYRERAVGSDAISERIIYPGQSIFTGPMLVHETEFLEDTFMVCAATVSRDGENYAADLVREALIPLAHHPV